MTGKMIAATDLRIQSKARQSTCRKVNKCTRRSGDVTQVDKVRLMLQRHQEQLQTIHELGRKGKGRTSKITQGLMHQVISFHLTNYRCFIAHFRQARTLLENTGQEDEDASFNTVRQYDFFRFLLLWQEKVMQP